MYIDSHLHFDSFVEAGTAETIVADARAAGVAQMVAIGGGDAANACALEVARAYPGAVFATAGYDRDEIDAGATEADLRAAADHPEVVAIGEAGLDYHYTPETAARQRDLFQLNLRVAAETGKPIVVHSRDADEDTLALLGDHAKGWDSEPDRLGVLHCFTRDWDFARACLDLGLHISFSGIATFRNAADLRDVATRVPLDRLLIETDAPYLAPVPHRGKRNQPAWVVHVAECLADVRGETVEQLRDATTANAQRLFGFPQPD